MAKKSSYSGAGLTVSQNAGPFGALNRDFPQNDTLGNHDLHSRSNFSSHASVASTASTVAPASRLTSHAAVSYNAYDARARRHRATHTPTEATSAEDTSTSGWVTTTTVNDPNVVGDWTGLTDDGEAAASSRVRWHQPTAVSRQAFPLPRLAINFERLQADVRDRKIERSPDSKRSRSCHPPWLAMIARSLSPVLILMTSA